MLGFGNAYYELKYFGASTGRWSGGGGLNMQNYNRKPAEGVDLRQCILRRRECRHGGRRVTTYEAAST